MDGAGGAARAATGPASAGAAGRWPFCHLRPERPVPPRHQPQQPPAPLAGTEGAGNHCAQRKADVAGGCRQPAGQRPPWQGHDRRQQARAQVAGRHDQGQVGPFPPELAGQAGRLFGPLGDHRGPNAQAAPVRSAQADGARAVQAVHLLAPRSHGHRDHHQGRQEGSGIGHARGVGHPGRGDQRAPRDAEPCAHAAPSGHPGL